MTVAPLYLSFIGDESKVKIRQKFRLSGTLFGQSISRPVEPVIQKEKHQKCQQNFSFFESDKMGQPRHFPMPSHSIAPAQ